MFKEKLGATVIVTALALITFANQNGERESDGQRFRLGQSVYIVAYHQVHEASVLHTRRDRYTVRNDLQLEPHVIQKFKKLKVFKVVDKISEAEFVFMVYRQEDAAEAYALAPDKYIEFKNRRDQNAQDQPDLDALREAAYGRYISGHFKLPTHGRMTNRLVEGIHATTVKKYHLVEQRR